MKYRKEHAKFGVNLFMKVKNMTNDNISTYQKLYSFSGKKLKNGVISAAIALVLAIIASLFDSKVFGCIFSVLSLIMSGSEYVSKILKPGKKNKIDDSILIVIAILIPFFIGEFVISAFAMSIYKFSNIAVKFVSGKVGEAIKNVAEILPLYSNVVDDGVNIRPVLSSSITKGTKIIVKTDEIVPVDCIIIDGFSDFDTSNVYEANINESLSAGDKALAGFVNKGSSVTCETICDYNDSLCQDMGRIASMSESRSTKGEKRFLGITKWYPLAVIAIAIVILIVGGFSNGEWGECMRRVSVLLIVATTASYIAAVPLLSSCAVWNLKRKGLALSSGDLLDEIADITCIAFEKDGVLTDNEFEIKDVYTADGISEEDFLMIMGNCIGGKAHPISHIMTKYMNKYLTAENVIEFPGKGVECTIMEKTFICGTESFVKECGIDISEIPGYSLYVSIDGSVLGAVKIADKVKTGCSDALKNLKDIGVEKLVMLTSEKKETAETAFLDCGADEYYSGITTTERAEIISKLKSDNEMTCAYIGSAENGAGATEKADVGMTLVGKYDNNLTFSKAVLLGNLRTVADAIEISRVAQGKIELHFYCASACKIILTILALFGAVNVATAVIIETLIMLFAFYSSFDLLKK